MNKISIAGSIAATVMALSLSASAQTARQDFSIQNDVGAPITSLYISPNDQNTWGSDVLGMDVLGNGEVANVHFDSSVSPSQCIWDVRIDTAGGQFVVQNLNLCAISAMRFSRQGAGVAWQAR